ncbi:MAG: DUF4336 domain-containing protein [Oscillatoriaceae cyanobacterium]
MQQYHPAKESGDWWWPLWPALPLYPYGQRRTLRREVVKDEIWTFDQIQGIFYVVVPIRMTVVKLSAGGLLVYAPVAPTRECVALMRELEAVHGEVKYIILPTVSGIEHKVFVGPFARRFPKATVFVAPSQWSFPLNLPLSWLGFPSGRTRVLPGDAKDVPFGDEFDWALLGPVDLGLGPFAEVALCHRRSGSLLLTDTIVSVPKDPPEIVQLDPYPLLFHARDDAATPITDSETNRRKGWQRLCLFTFYFQPSALDVVNWGETFRNAWKAADRSPKAYFGLFPFQWWYNWQQSFDALSYPHLLVAPILQTLILNRAPKATLDWADKVASWNFQRIIPCHLDAPIAAEPRQFRQAFGFLEKSGTSHSLPEADLAFMKRLDTLLNRWRITPPAQEKI